MALETIFNPQNLFYVSLVIVFLVYWVYSSQNSLSASYSGIFIKGSISWQPLSEKDLRILKVNDNDTNKQFDQSIW